MSRSPPPNSINSLPNEPGAVQNTTREPLFPLLFPLDVDHWDRNLTGVLFACQSNSRSLSGDWTSVPSRDLTRALGDFVHAMSAPTKAVTSGA